MKKWLVLSLLSMLSFTVAAEDAPKPAAETKPEDAPTRVLKTEKERYTYALAFITAQRLKEVGSDIDTEQLMSDLKELLAGAKPLMTTADVRKTVMQFQQAKQAADMAKHSDKDRNKKESEEFLAGNAKKDGIVTTQSGLQYQVLREGTGPKPRPEDSVTCHYAGTLVDGTKFDSSYDRGEPAQFPVRGVIAGWTEALQLMPVGSKWKLFIPANIAYGERGRPPKIGPESALIFEIELLSIDKPGQPK